MYYKEILKNIRANLNTPEVQTQSLITAKGEEKDQRTTEDLLSISRDWLSQIKNSSREAMKLAPKSSGSFTDNFAASFSATSKKVKEAKEEEAKQAVAKERKDGFIARRSEESPSTYAPKRPSEFTSFEDAIDATEGGGDYNTLFGFSEKEGRAFEGVNVSEMTIGELKKFANPSGEYGQWVKQELANSGQKARVATPMGRYQFVGSTLFPLAKELGLDDNTVFDKTTQDQLFNHYLGKTMSSAETMDGKLKALRGAWEGFKHLPDATLSALVEKYEG